MIPDDSRIQHIILVHYFIAIKSNWLYWSKIYLLNDSIYLILSTDGSAWTAGSNEQGQLSGDTTSRPTFTRVQGVPAVKEIAAGLSHCIVLTQDNEVSIIILSQSWAGLTKPPPIEFSIGYIYGFEKVSVWVTVAFLVSALLWCYQSNMNVILNRKPVFVNSELKCKKIHSISPAPGRLNYIGSISSSSEISEWPQYNTTSKILDWVISATTNSQHQLLWYHMCYI